MQRIRKVQICSIIVERGSISMVDYSLKRNMWENCIKIKKKREFLDLKQNNLILAEYESEFVRLSKYAKELISS
ncbi:hypothetical protein EPI10_006092 [Gossypium australe]|uniref:Gag-Pol polyprotein n=1 Tax=Gossypium australe TaxID=47621 RepID=A0A5B6WS88_9ROSI|nr:hypothetical protein EPI10_006092 [Gossypium australe]